MAGVHQAGRQPVVLQDLEQGNPIHPRGLHRDRLHATLQQPGRYRLQLHRVRPELAHRVLVASFRDAYPHFRRPHVDASRIGAGDFEQPILGTTVCPTTLLAACCHRGDSFLLCCVPSQQNRSTRKESRTTAGVSSLRCSGTTVLAGVLKAGDSGTTKPTSYETFTAERLDRFIDSHPDCKLVIAACGLPSDFANMEFWKKKAPERPKLVLLNVSLANVEEPIRRAFVSAALIPNPAGEIPVGINFRENYADVFRALYFLVDVGNLDDTATKYAGLGKK